MPLPAIFTKKFYEQVFENRNRSYGAYALRRSYARTMIFALSICCVLLLTVAFGAKWFSEAPPVKEAPEARAKKVVADASQEQYKVVEIRTAPDKQITADASVDRYTTNPATPVSGSSKASSPSQANADKKTSAATNDLSVQATTDVDYVSISKYLTDHVEYPEDCRAEKLEGTVTVCFFLESDGTFSRPSVSHTDDSRMSEAVMKAFREMPNCKASKSKNSSVQCRLPVRFRLDK